MSNYVVLGQDEEDEILAERYHQYAEDKARMIATCDAITQRSERVQDLDDKAKFLKQNADMFQRTSSTVRPKRKLWWQRLLCCCCCCCSE